MPLRPLAAAVLALAATLAAAPPAAADTTATGELRVCSDPDNMPFSNLAEAGFENRIADLLAADLGLTVRYTWDAQYRGFLRRTLRENDCDVVIGLPYGFPGVKTTRPYYRSSYVFVTAPARAAPPASFDDPALATARIGLPALGLEGAATPPAAAIAARGLSANVEGFRVWGGADDPDPQRRLVEAVASGTVDVAVVWGPVAGWYAKPFGSRIALTPILADPPAPQLRFSYEIAVATRKSDGALRDRLQGALDRHRAEIRAVLDAYGVPDVDTRAHRDAS